MQRIQAGHVRPFPEGRYGGVVHGLGGSSGAEVEGPTLELAQANAVARARAKELNWSPPYRWDGPDDAGAYALIASDTTLPGAKTDEEE